LAFVDGTLVEGSDDVCSHIRFRCELHDSDGDGRWAMDLFGVFFHVFPHLVQKGDEDQEEQQLAPTSSTRAVFGFDSTMAAYGISSGIHHAAWTDGDTALATLPGRQLGRMITTKGAVLSIIGFFDNDDYRSD
jgi:hypothetical protein